MTRDPNQGQQATPQRWAPPPPDYSFPPADAPQSEAQLPFVLPPFDQPLPGGDSQVREPPTETTWVVVAFIFFWPVGIAALMSSLKIRPAWHAGDSAGAERFAQKTRTLAKIALGIGILLAALYLIATATW